MYGAHVYFIVYVQDGATALHIVCQFGHRDVVSLLLTHGSDIQALTKVCHMYCHVVRLLWSVPFYHLTCTVLMYNSLCSVVSIRNVLPTSSLKCPTVGLATHV